MSPLLLTLLCLAQSPDFDDPRLADQQPTLDLLGVAEAWEITRGRADVVVGVLDMGFDFFHPDLKGKLRPGYFAPGGFHTEVTTVASHGTAVASIIGAEGGNGLGMVGLAPGCSMLSASQGMIEQRMLQLQREFAQDNPTSDMKAFRAFLAAHSEELKAWGKKWAVYQAGAAAGGIRYLVDHGARVINISALLVEGLIPSQETWTELEAAFAHAAEHDVLICLGAGNNAQKREDYPGDSKTMLVVGASLLDDTRWEMNVTMGGQAIPQGSNWGKRLSVMAPSEKVVACVPHEARFYTSDATPVGPVNDDFDGEIVAVRDYGATSCATPVVSALAALIYSVRPELKVEEVVEIIEQGCDDLEEPGWDEKTGWGRVNFINSLDLAIDRGR